LRKSVHMGTKKSHEKEGIFIGGGCSKRNP
jgi:hypothetical protein